jgi:hypothetical protein
MTPAYHRQYVKFEKQTAYLRGDKIVVNHGTTQLEKRLNGTT